MQKVLETLRQMYPETKTGLNYKTPFQLLVAAILSAQCTDRKVNQITGELFRRFPTSRDLARAPVLEVEGIIRPLGLARVKSRYVVEVAQKIEEEFHGEVPREEGKLLSLPGVGPKVAGVVMSNAFNLPALAVDTHVYRVARRLGLANGRTPHRVRKELEALIPASEWGAFHHRLVRHGREVCRSRRPRCNDCALKSLCFYFRTNKIKQSALQQDLDLP